MAESEDARKIRVAIIGSGNIGTDLVAKVTRSPLLELVGLAGIDPSSEGLARARAQGVFTTHDGLEDLLESVHEIDVAFDATSASAHQAHSRLLVERGILSIDLTPAGLGPSVVPSVNLGDHLSATEITLITCGAQATVPIVAALSAVTTVAYAEVVSTVSARSAGPGTRQNIDEFTQTTADALETVGGATRGKAIIILNPADPPILMRNTVYAEAPGIDADDAATTIDSAVKAVAAYVPGYRLRNPPLVDGDLVTVFIEVEGAGDYLPRYAGNLDIMTSAAVRVAEAYATVGSL
jgi:acetaldehyde dehydrogenase (acetylating)